MFSLRLIIFFLIFKFFVLKPEFFIVFKQTNKQTKNPNPYFFCDTQRLNMKFVETIVNLFDDMNMTWSLSLLFIDGL